MTWTGVIHAPGNSATIQVIARAFPGQKVRVLADASHLAELRRDAALTGLANVDFYPIEVSPLFRGKTHIVSARRFRQELATLRSALHDLPPDESCLLMLISATPTTIFAASLLGRWLGRQLGVQVGLHGNLNEITQWRPRNPLTRRFDLASALSLSAPIPKSAARLRFLVLEQPIKDALARVAPAAAARTDVLPLPINLAELPEQVTARMEPPIRIGFVGQGTQAKGFDLFLALARDLKARYGERVAFHLIGRAAPGTDPGPLAVLADPPSNEQLPRAEFVARLAKMHYVLLPFRGGYYDLSASGALIDAITWLKPLIATNVPLVRHLFDRFGGIGFACDDESGLRQAVEMVLADMNQQRYDAQIAALRQVRDSRRPEILAETYRTLVASGFPGLLD
ncbi:MAG: glycosyltransferase [Alphaproteobacteria bacterium]|nr:glycosyltransferase [Alphaproteobacteria bacterium]